MKNELYHYNVPGSEWYKHKQGKWQSHAQYAMGQANPDAKEKKTNPVAGKVLSAFGEKRINAVKDAFKKSIDDVMDKRRVEVEKRKAKEALERERAAKRAEAKEAVKQFVKTGKMPEKSNPNLTTKTHSGNTLGMTTEELKEATNRLRAENEYLREFENRAKLEASYRDITAPASTKRLKGLIKTAKNIGKSDVGKVASNFAMASFKEAVAKQYGKDFANAMFAGTRIDRGGKGGNGDQNGQQNSGGNNSQNKKNRNKNGNKNGNRQ